MFKVLTMTWHSFLPPFHPSCAASSALVETKGERMNSDGEALLQLGTVTSSTPNRFEDSLQQAIRQAISSFSDVT